MVFSRSSINSSVSSKWTSEKHAYGKRLLLQITENMWIIRTIPERVSSLLAIDLLMMWAPMRMETGGITAH